MKEKITESEQYLLHAYNRYQVVLDHGEGVRLYDTDGKEYLDFGGGIAVCALGYGNENFNKALKSQIDKAIHYSNFFYSEPLRVAAKKVTELTGYQKVFFSNSGTEANEGAMKLARKYALSKGYSERHEIISMDKAFHGRSMGALSITGTKKYREPFEPMLPDVKFATYNDLNSVEKLVSDKTYAIIVEAVQGEGGIYPADPDFLQGIRRICDERDIVMICDEIQCGMGRTGRLFGFENFDVRPDIVTMAKGIGNGIPVGAFVADSAIAETLVPGDHGTTFGGNPLAMTAVSATIDEFVRLGLIDHVREVGDYMGRKLSELVEKKDIVTDARGIGLMRGLELREAVAPYISEAVDKGLILMAAGANVIRFVPPLVIQKTDIDEMIDILDDIL